MPEFTLRPKAREDLESIWDYTVTTWGHEQAERYIRHLNTAFLKLATDPTAGRACDLVRKGYRKLRAGHHVIFYKIEGQGIDIIRILHERMDFERHL